MTYAAAETDKYLSSPVELYEFDQVSVQFFRYTSNDMDVSFGGFNYTAVPIERSRIIQNQALSRNVINITVARDDPVVEQYVSKPPSRVVDLTIRRFHRLDPDDEVIVYWRGRVINVEFKGDNGILVCEPLITAMRRPSLRRLYQTICPHVLYRTACGVNEVTFRVNAVVSGFSGLIVSAPQYALQADNYYAGGLVRITKDGLPISRSILAHTGTNIELDLVIPGLAVGDTLQSIPGCDRRLTTCINKFNNVLNFGGFPYIPDKNPMGGGVPIW